MLFLLRFHGLNKLGVNHSLAGAQIRDLEDNKKDGFSLLIQPS